MARTRRRMMKSPRGRAKRKADWVYRSAVFDSAAGVLDDLYTYGPQASVLASGGANANAAILYDSHNYTGTPTAPTAFDAPRVRLWSPARAEGSKAYIHRVRGTLFLVPSVWSVGSTFRYGIRFGIFEQDPAVGALLIDINYNMWTSAASMVAQPATWANDRKWVHEYRFAQSFSAENDKVLWTLRFNFPVRRRLNPHECFAMYTETAAGSVTLNEQKWFSTLVSDEQ